MGGARRGGGEDRAVSPRGGTESGLACPEGGYSPKEGTARGLYCNSSLAKLDKGGTQTLH